jgi:predicted molibdopterin-dependent oxidoreductase YjgC
VKLTIDGREVVCREGQTLLEAARGAGIGIPSLCDHRDLVPFAGCRICLVEVDGRKDFAPSCATPAEEGLVVHTRTPAVLELRKKVLEFILAAHPYACLVCTEKASCDDLKSTIRKVGEVTGCVLCPENGGCELQKVVEQVGLDRVDMPAVYRNRDVRRSDPFFDRDDNLCILCGRCIRVCEEVRGASVLSFVRRGGRTEVGTAFDRTLLDSGCRFCGACVDVCPTAALVERAARPQPRPDRTAAIVCPFCAQGCVLDLGIREDRVLHAKPADAPPNNGQACVKGRFLVRGALDGPGRILEPRVRRDGRLVPATFEEALDAAAAGLAAAAEGRRALVYPAQVPLEDAFVFLEFGRAVFRAGAVDASPEPSLELAIDAFAATNGGRVPAARGLAEIGTCGSVLAWDIDLAADHPIAWVEVVRAVRRGAGLVVAGRAPSGPIGLSAVELDLGPGAVTAAADLAAAVLRGHAAPPAEASGFDEFKKTVGRRPGGTRVAKSAFAAAAALLTSRKPAVVLFDAGSVAGPAGPETLGWLWNIALLTGGRLVALGRGANERGVHELELALGPAASRKSLKEVRDGLEEFTADALYLAGPAPDLGDRKPSFLVCQDTHWSRNAERADVVLPSAAFAECGGTWINTEGRVRTYPAACPPPGAARPDREILIALAGRMGRTDLAGRDPAGILAEIVARVPRLSGYDPAEPDRAFFLREGPSGEPRFAAVAPAPARARCAAAGPVAASAPRSEVLRGYDPVAANRGYARLRRNG